ncbi:putative actin interacting protein 1 [Cystobasidium minutum MCA 4210]|uniref:putative actin interacting protein 1 n=1 Tax=Cystobasidium minutum MCA 4210 TaxID=1397322 RepID=UPI0034CD748F|eukprot:jgi/Rhomi1/150038/estExt_Genewise1.C_2_t20275
MSYSKGIVLPPAPATTRGASTKLGMDPKGERIIYCNSRSVFLRSLNGSQPTVAYAGHVKDTTVAKVSPSGFYVASADVSGTVRVWDLAGEDQVLKTEVKALGGRINDLAWDSESKRILVGGDGRDRFAHAFAFDTGSSVGELSGHSKVVNAVALRPNRPFRAVTGSDDRTLVFSHGVPYKYAKSLTEHSGFVQDVAFSPSGQHFVSVGADGKVLLYDGATGDFVASLSSSEAGGHKGTIFSVSWAKDSKCLCTSGADRTVKVWDIESKSPITSWTIGDSVDSQQVGCVWSPAKEDEIVSLSFDGTLNVLDASQGDRPSRKLYGHQKGIVSMSHTLVDQATFFTGSYDGRVHAYDLAKQECQPIEGAGPTNSILAIATSEDGKAYVTGMDDTIREVSGSAGQYSFSSSTSSTQGLPKALALDHHGNRIYATGTTINILAHDGKSSKLTTEAEIQALDVSKQGTLAAGLTDGKIQLFDLSTAKAHSTQNFSKNRGTVTSVSFSLDGSLLAAGDSNGKIVLYSMPGGEVKTSAWAFHTAKIASIAWSPSGTRAVSGSLDTNVYIWNTVKPTRNIAIKNVHPGGVTGVAYLDEDTIVTTGADATVRTFKIKHHAV